MPESGSETGTDDATVLWRLACGYPSGSWFVIHDCLTHIPNDKEHRWVIAQETAAEVAVAAFIRSATSATGLLHPRHPDGHAPDCRIDRNGRVGGRRDDERPDIPWLIKTRLLSADTHSCLEPVDRYVAAFEQMRTAWEASRSTPTAAA